LVYRLFSFFYQRMQIFVDHIVPDPLKERLANRPSDVWNAAIQFNQPDFIKIKAPSGSGKTTLIHLLYQLRKDCSGSIRIDSKKTSEFSFEELATLRQQKLSIIFQDMRLFPQLTAWENIELKRNMTTLPACTAEAAKEMVAMLGVSHVLQQTAATLSYGEQQRIAIIRALVQPFEMLLMDEPFSHLDMANAQKAADLIAAECHRRNAGLLITDLDDDQFFDYTRFLQL
jgi:ABC-type lipoprotein export system ATPase subunit